MKAEHTRHIQDFIRNLVSAIANVSLYSPGHRQVHRLCSKAMENLREAMSGSQEIVLLRIEDELIFGNTPLEASMSLGKLNQIMASRGIGHVKFLPDVSQDEIHTLAISLSGRKGPGDEIRSTDNIRLGKIDIQPPEDDEDGSEQDDSPGIIPLEDIPFHEVKAFNEIHELIARKEKISANRINNIVDSFIFAFNQAAAPLLAITPLRLLDEYTYTHSTNVCILNIAQAMSFGVKGPQLHKIGVAAMLHDIGKLFIPEEILTKPGKLEAEEMDIIKQHPLKGANYLLEMTGIPKLAIVCCFEHHLRYNQTGYPTVREDWQQNLVSQMTAVSDYFDALRTKRVYRGPLDFETVAGMMIDISGTELHPGLTRNFLRLLARLQEQQ
ncbi:MAG: HD domain-containing protein [Geobacteraceae bacterium]|nr:HD domain-containing protein [Geobacteraceae bacterium]